MIPAVSAIIYLMFFLSGASALVYQVAWVRSLSLVFGGSHLAVTTVLSIFMGGLAAGGFLFGRRTDALKRPLRTYGLLEIGIGACAALFLLLVSLYPRLYVPLARLSPENAIYLTSVRVLFAVAAMAVPTTLMGATLPVLTRASGDDGAAPGVRLSFLYGFNTLGAVAGTLVAAFFLLGTYGVNATIRVAIAANLLIGLAALLLQARPRRSTAGEREYDALARSGEAEPRGDIAEDDDAGCAGAGKLALWGIGISGFCALGYEVLWTRMLSMVVGATVYGFSTMLVAFLTGIALGSKAFGLLLRLVPAATRGWKRSMVFFGIVQVAIGVTALAVTYFLRDLPAHAIRIQNLLLGADLGEFEVRQGANFAVAFSHMFVPAFFMGMAFPLAARIRSGSTRSPGRAVGETLAYNTLGAILGAGLSGFALIYLFGIERSLQFLTLVNMSAGAIMAIRTRMRPLASFAIAAATGAVMVVLAINPALGRMWDRKYFAIYRSNAREAFSTSFNMKDAMENTDVLYYAEGVDATVSAIKVKGGHQAFITNGRVEASDHREGVQCQYTLGHLPMLLARNPKKVFVLGTGSGMTLGATSVHPGVERIVLAEIEPKVLGVARTFSKYNHDVLENPKLKIVFDDGRNFLLTTREKFDVITADPIHPWFSGAGYLYTQEYFRLAADRLRPGGIVCQWLPIYELTVDDLKCVVRTFAGSFKYSMLWLTRNDAELVGSNDPIVIDEAELDRRIAAPGVAGDLMSVNMGSAEDLLSYFVMGTEGLKAFAGDGLVNTDDNLRLEFSAPLSVGVPLMGRNARALYPFREPVLPYLLPASTPSARAGQVRRWERNFEAGRSYAEAHVLFLRGGYERAEFREIVRELDRSHGAYAPLRFLKGEVEDLVAMNPKLLRAQSFVLLGGDGRTVGVEISAVMVPVGRERAAVIFVDNFEKRVFGQIYVDARAGELEGKLRDLADMVLSEVDRAYRRKAQPDPRGWGYPAYDDFLRELRGIISSMTPVPAA